MGVVSLSIIVMALISLGLSGYAASRDTPLEWRFMLPDQTGSRTTTSSTPRFERVLDYTVHSGQAHSPALIIQGAQARIVWFEGTAEAQADVDILSVVLDLDADATVAAAAPPQPEPLITREDLASVFKPRQLVVTLGNTIENEASPGHVFATVVSVGGWAMASVADVALGSQGPVAARKLNLSPFLNRSHLVKSPMVAFADGSWGLPAYFELGVAHGALVRFDPDGRVRDQRRISGADVKAIQPMIVVQSETDATAFLRDFDPSGVLWQSRTKDGGQSWSPVTRTDLPNPSAPVAALPLPDGRVLMAMNDAADRADRLSLVVVSGDGQSWDVIHTLEGDGGDARYPMLRRLPSGEMILVYSHATKRGIRAVVFNDAWVAAQ